MLRRNDILNNDRDALLESSVPVTPADVRKFVELAPLPSFVLDALGHIVVANGAFGRLLDRKSSELGEKDIREFLASFPEGTLDQGDATFIRSDGSAVAVEVFCRRLPTGGNLICAVDHSKRNFALAALLESERKRWQSQRIEALGRLAGGIAHDFNNFLAVLLLQVDILNLHLEPDSPIRERVNEIKEVSNSVAGTVRQLFAFGRKQPMTLAPVGLNSVVEDFATGFQEGFPAIHLDLELSSDLGLCFVDQIQIALVLQNLAVNSVEGMPDGGSITVRTSNFILDPSDAPEVQPPGSYIEISISDTGMGLDPTTEDFIFEPFFSNEESSKGAGLTLAMVYGIVKQSKGFIWAETTPGRGTTFKLQFPRIDLGGSESGIREGDRLKGHTVLLVDDEAAVRRVTAEFLKMSEYEVLQAGTGMEALEIAQSFVGPIHLLLTDLSMPFMDGKQVAEKITRIHPEATVLFMSGNIDHMMSDDGVHATDVHFISKPFSSIQLADKVRQILASKTDSL